MYCKYCGKEIADDSAFCRYCGGQLQESVHEKSKQSVLNRFQSLSKGWQITIMVYVIWFLLTLCLWLAGVWDDWFDDRKGWVTEIIHVLIIPMLTLFVWYYFARLRKMGKRSVTEEKAMANSVQNLKLSRVPLIDFAKAHGKMQVKTVANPITNEVHSFCVFTNEQGIETKVEFGKSLGPLSPQEIADRKEQLVVLQKEDGSFDLCVN